MPLFSYHCGIEGLKGRLYGDLRVFPLIGVIRSLSIHCCHELYPLGSKSLFWAYGPLHRSWSLAPSCELSNFRSPRIWGPRDPLIFRFLRQGHPSHVHNVFFNSLRRWCTTCQWIPWWITWSCDARPLVNWLSSSFFPCHQLICVSRGWLLSWITRFWNSRR